MAEWHREMLPEQEGSKKLVDDHNSFLEAWDDERHDKFYHQPRDGDRIWVPQEVTVQHSVRASFDDTSLDTSTTEIAFPHVNAVLHTVLSRKVAVTTVHPNICSPFTWVKEPFEGEVDQDGVPRSIGELKECDDVPQSVQNGWAFSIPGSGKVCSDGANLETLFEELFKWAPHLILTNPEEDKDCTKNISNGPWYSVGEFCNI